MEFAQSQTNLQQYYGPADGTIHINIPPAYGEPLTKVGGGIYAVGCRLFGITRALVKATVPHLKAVGGAFYDASGNVLGYAVPYVETAAATVVETVAATVVAKTTNTVQRIALRTGVLRRSQSYFDIESQEGRYLVDAEEDATPADDFTSIEIDVPE